MESKYTMPEIEEAKSLVVQLYRQYKEEERRNGIQQPKLQTSHGNLRTAVKTKTGMKSKSVAEAAKLLEKVKARLKCEK